MEYAWTSGDHFASWVDGTATPLVVSPFRIPIISDIGEAIGRTVGKVARGAVNFARKVLGSRGGRAAVLGLCSLLTANPVACGVGVEAARRVLDRGGKPSEAASAAAAQPGGEAAALAITLTSRGGAGDPLALPHRVYQSNGWWWWWWEGTTTWATAPQRYGQTDRTTFRDAHGDGSLWVSVAGSQWRTVEQLTTAIQRS